MRQDTSFRRTKKTLLIAACAVASAVPAIRLAAASQVTFEQTIGDLKSADANTRLRAVELLKDSGYPEAAVPLAAAIGDDEDQIQVEAIAAELNIFLAQKVTSSRRVGLVIEVRNRIAANASFAAGRSVVGPRDVPGAVPDALRAAMHDTNPKVALEAIYAFGTLAPEVTGADRPGLLRASAPDLASMLGVQDPDARLAALQVIARVYRRRAGDADVEQMLGDAVIGSLNEKNADLRIAAMQALGAVRYSRGVQALTELFQYYKRGTLAEHALDALARIGSPASNALFVAQLSSTSPVLKTIGIEGLARIGDPAKGQDVDSAGGIDRSDSVALASAFFSASVSKGSIDSLVDGLTRARLHDQSYGYLAELAPGRSPLFTQGTRDPDPQVRAEVADILGVSGDAAAIPMVEAMKQDQDPRVARAADRAAARLRSGR